MASVLVPVLYLIVVFGSLALFSHFYRKRTAGKSIFFFLNSRGDTYLAQTFDPYFESHPERDAYVTLIQITDPPVLDATLKAALVRRAMTDVTRVIRLREDKPALQNLLQKGSIGDDLWNSMLAAERELEAEIMEVVSEANSFVEGWGQSIFQTASEMIANEEIRSTFENAAQLRAEYGSYQHTFWVHSC
jgi:translocation protein SEC66